jgi:hypothetical protein
LSLRRGMKASLFRMRAYSTGTARRDTRWTTGMKAGEE